MPMSDLGEKPFTVKEVADHFRVTRRAVYGWIRDHGLPASRAGRFWYVQRADLEQWFEANKPTRK